MTMTMWCSLPKVDSEQVLQSRRSRLDTTTHRATLLASPCTTRAHSCSDSRLDYSLAAGVTRPLQLFLQLSIALSLRPTPRSGLATMQGSHSGSTETAGHRVRAHGFSVVQLLSALCCLLCLVPSAVGWHSSNYLFRKQIVIKNTGARPADRGMFVHSCASLCNQAVLRSATRRCWSL